MHDLIQPLVHKTAVHDLAVVVRRTDLSIGDTAELHELPDGRIGVFTARRKSFLGLFPRQQVQMLGILGPKASRLVGPSVAAGDFLRIRIVGLTPEHLSPDGQAEVHVSIWGDPRLLSAMEKSGQSAVSPNQTGVA